MGVSIVTVPWFIVCVGGGALNQRSIVNSALFTRGMNGGTLGIDRSSKIIIIRLIST